MDRLEEIRKTYEDVEIFDSAIAVDIDWLIDEIERLREIIKCKDVLLIAYRLGTNRGVGKALDRLHALGED